jgi:DNA-binding NarL/FixJ family response regulator
MYVRIAVSDPLPVFRRGVLASLAEHGFEAENRDDLVRWARAEPRRVVLLTLHDADDWGLLADLCRPPGEVIVVVLLSDPSVASYVRALSAGATAVVRRDGSPNAVREAFEAALAGKVILPAAVVRALASTGGHAEQAPESPTPTTLEADWLRQLAQGTTVARLAEQAGYSERMMFRLLRDLYRKLGGTNRTDALMRARDQGWI